MDTYILLLLILIITGVIINIRLGNVPINNRGVDTSTVTNVAASRYETALIENFVIDTEKLEDEISEANTPTASAGTGDGDAEANAAASNNLAANNIAEQIKEAINSQNDLSNNLSNTIRNDIVNKNNTISDKFIVDEDNIFDMMKKLEDVEVMCSKLDKEQKLKDDLEQIHINKSALQELNNQEKRIEELSNIVQHLRREKEKRDIISNKCRVKRQVKLDKDYNTVTDLVKKGFLKDESRKINIKLPEDGLKFDFSGLPKADKADKAAKAAACPRAAKKPSKEAGFDLNKLNDGVCYGCDANVLKKSVGKINRDFGQ